MKHHITHLFWSTSLVVSVLTGCRPAPEHTEAPASAIAVAAQETPVVFTDVTEAAGIRFQHVHGGFGKKWLPETMGSGLAWIDYDGDGYQDLFVVNSREWTPAERKGADRVETDNLPATVTSKLYRNLGNGRFRDVTAGSGLDVPMYGMGACVGDYDNDGRPDLYVTALGRNYLFRNVTEKGERPLFQEIAEQAGVRDRGWSTSAAWVDYDRDGRLDLVVGHYVKWTPATDIPFPRQGRPTYGTPQQYVGEPLRLYHNEGGGRFADVSRKAGMLTDAEGRTLQGKTLGITICDYDNDGWPDIAVANDTEPNYLFRNQGDGTFKEEGIMVGIGLPDNGVARGAMGIDACDYDRKGREGLMIGNFSKQGLSLYRNEGAIFRDVAPDSGVFQPSLLSLTFGCFFLDVDNDGWRDMFVANGHVDDRVQEIEQQVEYAQKPHLFRNLGNGRFVDIVDRAGDALKRKYVARGAAYADYDLIGAPAIAISTSNGPVHLFRNEGTGSNRSLRLELEGTKSNRSAIGAAITVQQGEAKQLYHVRSGSSYLSQSELPVTVGLGTAPQADQITIRWPSGETTVLNAVAAGRIYRVVEGKGIVSERPFKQSAARAGQQGDRVSMR